MRRAGTNGPERTAGAFTLVELMTVMVLIGILTALMLPDMRGTFEAALLRSTARDLVNVFELASSRAISLHEHLRVRIDPAEGRYGIERQVRDGAREGFMPLKDVLGSQGLLDKRIQVRVASASDEPGGLRSEIEPFRGESDSAVSFYPDGTAEAVKILLKDRAGFRLGLRINPITGRVHTLELQPE
jgi:prepilin-type N-terminal cleavage/methylation domain-containing protein